MESALKFDVSKDLRPMLRAQGIGKCTILMVAVVAMLLVSSLASSAIPITLKATQTSFINQAREHEIPITLTFSDDQDVSLDKVSCSLGGGLANCISRATDCKQDGNTFTCKLVMSPIDYMAQSSLEHFDPSSRKLTLSGNTVTISYSSESSSGKAVISIDDITVTVVAVCGNKMCERTVGESPTTCCMDCPCPTGQACFTGAKANGECVYTTSKEFFVASMDPPSAKAIPFPLDNQWHFTTRMVATLAFNLKDFNLSTVWMKVGATDYKLNCTDPFSGAGDAMEANCSFVLPPIKAYGELTGVGVEFSSTIAFADKTTEQGQGLTTTHTILASSETETVQGCKEKLAYIDSRISKLTRDLSSIHKICAIWASGDRQKSLREAVDSCCSSGDLGDCMCSYAETGTLEEVQGQDHSCYLCAKPCLCDSRQHYENLLEAYKLYREGLGSICSSTEFDALATGNRGVRQAAALAQNSMDAIEHACQPTTKKSNWCDKDDFPSCELKSGLRSHNDTDIFVTTLMDL